MITSEEQRAPDKEMPLHEKALSAHFNKELSVFEFSCWACHSLIIFYGEWEGKTFNALGCEDHGQLIPSTALRGKCGCEQCRWFDQEIQASGAIKRPDNACVDPDAALRILLKHACGGAPLYVVQPRTMSWLNDEIRVTENEELNRSRKRSY